MNIVFATSECIPFAKTGGLADVCGSLPIEIAKLGHQTCVFLPAYPAAKQAGIEFRPLEVSLEIPISAEIIRGTVLQSRLPQSNIPVYLIEQPKYFDRGGLYGENGTDYGDNCQRFAFFCRAVLETFRAIDLKPNLIHCNDWQTGLIPAYLSTEYAGQPDFENVSTLMTIHNLAYQGVFWHWDMLLTGIDWKHFNWREMEFYGQLNLLKTGIAFADAISTVSPTYAKEIQTAELGCGLETILRHRRANLTGIINGIDESWDPSTDPNIAANYDESSWELHKPKCKLALQKELNLPQQLEVPVIGLVGRLAQQKGWSLILEVLSRKLEYMDVQWAILGTGQPDYHEALGELANRFPDKLGLMLGFDNGLAHRIEAGSDMFLMPSEYEPCGLNQMYSLKYGTLPIVRATGGLVDTVVDADTSAIEQGTANGFSFGPYNVEALDVTLERAIGMFFDYRDIWKQLVNTAMRQDFSWAASARRYEQLYEKTIAQHRAAGGQLVK